MGLTAADILAELGIQYINRRRYYTTCPHCSHTRKGAHKKLRCLGVTIDETGIRYGCNHCEYKGGKFYDDQRQTSPVARKPGHRSGNGGSFRSFYG